MGGHTHAHGPLESYDHVRGGAPVLDIGGDVGALVVTVDDRLVGTELHLRAENGPPVHTGVWSRDHAGGRVAAAVFPALGEGAYWVLDAHGDDVAPVHVSGGELTELELRHA